MSFLFVTGVTRVLVNSAETPRNGEEGRRMTSLCADLASWTKIEQKHGGIAQANVFWETGNTSHRSFWEIYLQLS